MTTHLITRKDNKLQLNGDLLSGDTYPVSGYIKAYLGGRWLAAQKAWQIDLGKLESILAQSNSIGLRIDDAPARSGERKPETWRTWKNGNWELGEDY
jgi:hypothetical protein